jgi:hypothetical protein
MHPASSSKNDLHPSNRFLLVVARYNEDIAWTNGYPRLIFNKGPRIEGLADSEQIMLRNVGREAHTYLTYIIHHYDSLPERVFFCQGRIDDHLSNDTIEHFLNPAYDFVAGRLCFTKEWDSQTGRLRHYGRWLEMLNQGSLKAAALTYTEWFEKVLGISVGEGALYAPGAIFCVVSKNIRQHPRSFYRKLLSYLENHSNPEEAHYMERSWLYIFAQKGMKILDLSNPALSALRIS